MLAEMYQIKKMLYQINRKAIDYTIFSTEITKM